MNKAVYKKITYLDNGVAGNVLAIGHMAGTLSQFVLKYSLTELPTDVTANANKYPILFSCISGIQGLKYCPVYSNTSKKLHMGYYIGYASQGTYYNTVAHTPTVGSIYEVGLSKSYYVYFKDGVNIHYKYKETSMPAFNSIGYLFGNQDVNLRSHIYHCRVDLDGVQIRDLIPMKRIEDGICGMFDNISKVFYAGTTEFIGPEEEVYYNANGNITEKYTLKEKLEHINETKSLIKNAIISKGQTITNTDTFRSYVDKINAIPAAGDLTQEEYIECLNISNNILGDYTQLEYIESTGTQGIVIDIMPNEKTELVLEYYKADNSTANIAHAQGFGIRTINNQYRLRYANQSTTTDTQIPFIANEKVKYRLGKGKFIVNDSTTYNLSTGAFQCVHYISIFGYASGSVLDGTHSVQFDSPGRAYDCKVYDDDVLVRHLIPVKRNSDGEICMYDLVTRKYYTNAGSGTLIAGGEI